MQVLYRSTYLRSSSFVRDFIALLLFILMLIFIIALWNKTKSLQESFYYWTTLNFEIPLALVLQFEVYCKVDRLLTGLTAKPFGTTAQWYSNKTPLQMQYKHSLKMFKMSKIFRMFKIFNRGVLFEYHRTVVPICWAVRPVRSLSTL